MSRVTARAQSKKTLGAFRNGSTSRSSRLWFLLHPKIINWVGLLAILIFWQTASGVLFNKYYLGTPLEIADQIATWFKDGSLLPHLVATVQTTALGFLIASIAGIATAIPLALSRQVDRTLSPFIYAGFALPKVVLAPIIIFWLGVGFAPSLALSAITGYFFVFYNAYEGLRGTSPALLNSVKLMGANPVQLIVKVRLPAAAPGIVLGLHQGLIYAFHGTIVGEMTASNLGIGYVIIYAATEMNTTAVLSGLFVLGTMGFGLTRILYAVAKRLPGGGEETS